MKKGEGFPSPLPANDMSLSEGGVPSTAWSMSDDDVGDKCIEQDHSAYRFFSLALLRSSCDTHTHSPSLPPSPSARSPQ